MAIPLLYLLNIIEYRRMRKSQIRLSACYNSGIARHILPPMHACHRAHSECLSQEGRRDRPAAFYRAHVSSFLFTQEALLTLLFQVGLDYFKRTLRSILFR